MFVFLIYLYDTCMVFIFFLIHIGYEQTKCSSSKQKLGNLIQCLIFKNQIDNLLFIKFLLKILIFFNNLVEKRVLDVPYPPRAY